MAKKSLIAEFKEFAFKGNMMDLAIGVIIGGAFNGLIGSFIEQIIMPVIGIFLGGIDLSKWVVLLPNLYGGAAIEWQLGAFLTQVLNFLILAVVVFLMVKAMNRLRHQPDPAPAPPPAPSQQELLLTEIRDLLKQQAGPDAVSRDE